MIDTDKKKLKSLVESLRKTLKEEIFKTLYERFLFQIKDKTRRQLSLEAKYELEKLTEYVASLGKDLNDRNSLDAILDDLIRKKSYTFINRLFFLKSQEASGQIGRAHV